MIALSDNLKASPVGGHFSLYHTTEYFANIMLLFNDYIFSGWWSGTVTTMKAGHVRIFWDVDNSYSDVKNSATFLKTPGEAESEGLTISGVMTGVQNDSLAVGSASAAAPTAVSIDEEESNEDEFLC